MTFWLKARTLAQYLGERVDAGMSWPAAMAATGAAYVAEHGIEGEHEQLHLAHTLAYVERWLQAGLPHIFLGERLGASFCATSVPADIAATTPLPFHCFGVSLPPGVLGQPADLFVLNATEAGKVQYMLTDSGGFHLGEEADLGGYADLDVVGFRGKLLQDEQDTAQRKLLAIGRIIVGIAIEMAALAPIQGRSGDGALRRNAKLPAMWEFRLSRPVQNDVRKEVREYLSGTRGPLALQHVVRGHWQRYHTRNGVIWKHKEPYFQGDEHSPIRARSYAVGGPKEST